MNQTPVSIIRSDCVLETSGLAKRSLRELRISVNDPTLVDESEALLRFVSAYLTQGKASINPGETLAYGYWLVKFEVSDDGLLEVFEYNPDATSFVRGAELTLTYWRDQHIECNRVGTAFSPPRPDRKVVISAGVYEGRSVDGVRYPSPEHMSGWWLTTDKYDGNVESLKTVHLYHVTAARPDLARYIALPYGFRFRVRQDQAVDVWFDEKVANEDRGNNAQ